MIVLVLAVEQGKMAEDQVVDSYGHNWEALLFHRSSIDNGQFGKRERLAGFQFSDQGLNCCLLQWKHRDLTTGQPRNAKEPLKNLHIAFKINGVGARFNKDRNDWRCRTRPFARAGPQGGHMIVVLQCLFAAASPTVPLSTLRAAGRLTLCGCWAQDRKRRRNQSSLLSYQ